MTIFYIPVYDDSDGTRKQLKGGVVSPVLEEFSKTKKSSFIWMLVIILLIVYAYAMYSFRKK